MATAPDPSADNGGESHPTSSTGPRVEAQKHDDEKPTERELDSSVSSTASNGDAAATAVAADPSTAKSPHAEEEAAAAAAAEEPQQNSSTWRRIIEIITWTPPNCRWDHSKPPQFSMALNILFAFAGAFTVANLYYNHPILNILAKDFDVPYSKVAQIPTLAQAGYAIGLWFLCPLGDLFKRRPFVLGLVLFTATMSIGLCVTQSFVAFEAIQFLVGLTTVTPQLMLPLVGDLAPPDKRAAALSIVVAGFMLGILLARLLSGIVTNFTSWRNVYWLSVGLQYVIFGMLWAFMPDYPATNKNLNYFKMLWSILVILTKHPVLVQACLIAFFTSATFTSFWTDLTFLLSSPPYNYSPVVIGLFALIGIAAMLTTPFYARRVIDKFVPLFTVLLGLTYCMLGICLGAYTGSFTVAGPILQAWLLDFGMQSTQIANRSSIFSIEPKARNRVNTAFMVATFFGQLVGTIVGAHLYQRAGWIGSQSYSVASIGMAILVTFCRGPWEEGWVGWSGGWGIRKKDPNSADGKRQEEGGDHLRRGVDDQEKGKEDLEMGLQDVKESQHHGHHHHHEHSHLHAHDNQNAVNATDPEKALEMQAAESDGEADDKGEAEALTDGKQSSSASSSKVDDDVITPSPKTSERGTS